MPEIIRAGTLPSERWYDLTCGSCRTYFKFQQKETGVRWVSKYSSQYTIQCPLCDKTLYMDKLHPYTSNVDPY